MNHVIQGTKKAYLLLHQFKSNFCVDLDYLFWQSLSVEIGILLFIFLLLIYFLYKEN